jgi:hypothetical protein
MVRASLTNGSSRERDAHASQASRCAAARRGCFELVEEAQLLVEQERAEHRLVGLLDLGEQSELGDRLLGRRLQIPVL